MLKAIKIRIYPNGEQQVYISKLIGSCRFIYNTLLDYRIKKYNEDKSSIGLPELGKHLTSLKSQPELSWLKESHSKVLQQSLINLDTAYKSFFKNKTGFPKFKSKHNNKQSCRFPVDAVGKVKGNRITLIRDLKDIHYKCSTRDEIYLNKYQDSIRSATLTKSKSGKYTLSILLDLPLDKTLPLTNKVIGIDLGIKDFIVTSDNTSFKNLKLIRNNKTKLARLHKQLSKKQNNSNNRNKARIKLAKYHEKLTNIKENYLHHTVNTLLNENQVIVMEDLNVKGMMRNHKLARSIQELSLNRFENILTYKSEWYGRDIIKIDRWYPSSKLCSDCGEKNMNLKLSEREWCCKGCGVKHQRDYNAAINIRNEGIRINEVGLSSPELTLVEMVTVDDKVVRPLKSKPSLKQEKNIFVRKAA